MNFSTSLIRRKCKQKPPRAITTEPKEWLKLKRPTTSNTNKGMRPTTTSYIAGSSAKWQNEFGKLVGSFLWSLTYIYPMTSNSTPRYLLKRNKTVCPQNVLYKNVQRSFIHNSLKLELTQIAIVWQMKK